MSRLLCLAAAAFVVASAPVAAQTLPSPDQAKRLLQTRPDLVAQLLREIEASRMTPDQIRARLRAAGYPEDLLDAYIGGSGDRRRGRDSLAVPLLSDDVLGAMAALGTVNSLDTSELRTTAPRRLSLRPVRSMVPDSGFTVFGRDVFASTTTLFDPNLAGQVDANYRLGPGDRLVLIVTGDAERAFTLDVTREGFVVIPGVGEVPVANLTLGQLEDQLYSKLGRVYSGLRRGAGATTHFSLNVARLHTNQIYVLGDVVEPASYRVSSAGTALTALYAAGGPSESGGMRRIEIRRAGRLVDTLDLYDYLLHGDGSHDVRLQSGDVVFVPPRGPRVRLWGEVVRPGTYELRRGESLADVVRAAGGFTAEAVRQRVQVGRILPPAQRGTADDARVVIDVASPAGSDAPAAFALEPGDVVRVFRVSDRVTRRVTVQGSVRTPGAVGFTAGMRLSDALRLSGGLEPEAYLGQVLVARLRAGDSARVQLRTALQDVAGHPTDDILLSQDDEIRVFSVAEFRAEEYVSVTGAVRRPGRYAYREGMTLRDVVLLAGGLENRASLREAEIARLPQNNDGGRLAVTERVLLDSSYRLVSNVGVRVAPGVVQAGAQREVALQPYDNVLILSQPDFDEPRLVVVAGEVQRPGSYVLLTKGDRLTDVIGRAGGLTSSASREGIAFYRRQNHVGRVGIDFARVMRDAGHRDNLILQDGDSIFLPPYSAVVDVQGAVAARRGVAWVPGANLEYYVRAAGGPTLTGDLGHSYVTQPDGSVESVVERTLWPNTIPVPRAGSVVYVSEKPVEPKVDPVARLSVIAQIVGSLVAIVAITRR